MYRNGAARTFIPVKVRPKSTSGIASSLLTLDVGQRRVVAIVFPLESLEQPEHHFVRDALLEELACLERTERVVFNYGAISKGYAVTNILFSLARLGPSFT